MSISSMTGFASVEASTLLGELSIECRSVNSKFLDLTLRLDEAVRFLEGDIRALVQNHVSRGKLELRISLARRGESIPACINEEALARLAALEASVRRLAPEARPLSVAEILEMPGIGAAPSVDREAFKGEVLGAALDALVRLKEARTREGEALARVILDYCGRMEAVVETVRSEIPKILENLTAKLTERLDDALARALTEKSALSTEEVQDRIRQEVTLYAVKLDVDEEMNRLATHLAEVRRLLAAGGPVGRKLDFMAQEMNREANTLGSKAAAIEMTNASLALKVTIDQMREQIQNLE